MPDSKRVTIVHADSREYGIDPSTFTDPRVSPEGSYAERGFEIVGYADGSVYDGPKSKRELEAAPAERPVEAAAKPDAQPAPKPARKSKAK